MLEAQWIWGILGLALLALEMLTGTLYILWFGIAAFALSMLSFVFPDMAIAWQLLIFAVLSLTSLFVWKQFYQRVRDDSNIGQSRGDEIGRIGVITASISPRQNGSIEFAQGVLGSRQWVAIANEEIEIGAEAIVVAVEGNRLRVSKRI